jgi:tetratricopeptide (TPR) repeat protein
MASIQAFLQIVMLLNPQGSQPDTAEWGKKIIEIAEAVKQGKADAAEAMLRQIVDETEKFGPNDRRLMNVLRVGGDIYLINGKLPAAREAYDRSLAIHARTKGMDDLAYAKTLHRLGLIDYMEGSFARAEVLLLKSCAIRKKVLGRNHPDYLESCDTLADVYTAEEKWSEAETLYRAVLSARDISPADEGFALTLCGLGQLLIYQKRYHEAEPLILRGTKILQETENDAGHTIATCLNNLAQLYLVQGKDAEATRLAEHAFSVAAKERGTWRYNMATSLGVLGEIHYKHGEYDAAETLFRRSLHVAEEIEGQKHPNVAIRLAELAKVCCVQEKCEEAERYLSRAVHITEECHGRGSTQLARRLEEHASVLKCLGRDEEASAVLQRVSVIKKTQK